MIKRKEIFYALIIIAAFAILSETLFFLGQGHFWPPVKYASDEVIRPITIMQSGGSDILTAECGDRNYITNASDYIIEGTVEDVESRWNEKKTSVLTYTNLAIGKYVKGLPFETTTGYKLKIVATHLQIVTPGGCVGETCQTVEDQPIFHKGKKVRIYFQRTNSDFSIVCSQLGVEEI